MLMSKIYKKLLPLSSARAIFHGNEQPKEEYLQELAAAKKDYEQEAQVLLGSDKVNRKKILGVVQYLKHEAFQKGRK